MNPLIDQILKPFTPEGQEMNFKEREAVVMEGGGDYSKTSIKEKDAPVERIKDFSYCFNCHKVTKWRKIGERMGLDLRVCEECER